MTGPSEMWMTTGVILLLEVAFIAWCVVRARAGEPSRRERLLEGAVQLGLRARR